MLGRRLRLSSLRSRKRRGSDARRRYDDGYVVIAEAPDLDRVGKSRRVAAAGQPPGVIEVAARERVRTLVAEGKSLRVIAHQIGVSHETVRKRLRA